MLTVNGEAIRYRLDPATPLVVALREASNLTGTKYGCHGGDCGACTVWVDSRATLSCQIAIGELEGADVTTIEGLAASRGHPLQQAWAEEQVSQCGRCDPGFIMALAALLRVSPTPDQAQIAALPNICRCGAAPRILKALARAGDAAAILAQPPAAPPPKAE